VARRARDPRSDEEGNQELNPVCTFPRDSERLQTRESMHWREIRPVTRRLAIAYAGLTAVEVAYVLRTNLPSLWPPPSCDTERSLAPCVLFQPAFPWPWMALTALLLLSAMAILLRKQVGIASGFVGQALLLAPFVRDMVFEVGSFLFTGSGYSGVDPSYRDLAFNFLALTVVIGPALALLLLMTMRAALSNRAPARIAAILLSVQLVILVLVAVIVFRATFQDLRTQRHWDSDHRRRSGLPRLRRPRRGERRRHHHSGGGSSSVGLRWRLARPSLGHL